QKEKYKAMVLKGEVSGYEWKVSETNGGTINSLGEYTAPESSGKYHIVASKKIHTTGNPVATMDVSDETTMEVEVYNIGVKIAQVATPTAGNLVSSKIVSEFTTEVTFFGESAENIINYLKDKNKNQIYREIEWAVAETNGGTFSGIYTAESNAKYTSAEKGGPYHLKAKLKNFTRIINDVKEVFPVYIETPNITVNYYKRVSDGSYTFDLCSPQVKTYNWNDANSFKLFSIDYGDGSAAVSSTTGTDSTHRYSSAAGVKYKVKLYSKDKMTLIAESSGDVSFALNLISPEIK
ncbi:MAG TPA: hypothetical protein PKK26_19085, partial [Candidatus Wallbacteria bacterium]|nr:hypothetical protein [Candidatus Wallbacteria bacterium]